MTKEEIDAKCDWEGGVTECIIGYGLDASNLPEDTPVNVVTAWRRLYRQGHKDVETIRNWLESDE